MSLAGNTNNVTYTGSIRKRLTLLYLGSTLILLICVLGFLMRTIIADLEFENCDFLHERLYSLHHMLAKHDTQFESIELLVESTATAHHTRYLVRILDEKSNIMLESDEMDQILPVSLMPGTRSPELAKNRKTKGDRIRGNDGTPYLVSSLTVNADSGRKYLIQAGLDISDEQAMLRKYQRNMLITLIICMAIATQLNMQLVKAGLRPLNELAARLQELTAKDLHHRIGSQAWPKELSRLTTALDGMLERLEKSFKRLKEFSANLAHELRTPLNIVRGEAEVCLASTRTPLEYQDVLHSAVEEYARLTHTIDDMLFLANSEQLKHLEILDVTSEMAPIIDFFTPFANEQKVSMQLHGEGHFEADRHLFQRLMMNLISNALKYTPPGGSVTITAHVDEQQAMTIAICDTGIGISPEDQALVFDRFYRTSQARQHNQPGSGLGLAIVSSIMELHNGTITLSSELGSGTTVTITFPPPKNTF